MWSKMSSMRIKFHWWLYYYVHLLTSQYISRDQQITFTCVSNKKFYFTHQFFSLLSNPYISNISNIYNPEKNSSLASQTRCDHMFSYPNLYLTFHVISLHNWLVFCFFSHVAIARLILRQESVVIYLNFIPDWI